MTTTYATSDPITLPAIRLSAPPKQVEDLVRIENARVRAMSIVEELDALESEAYSSVARIVVGEAKDRVLAAVALLRGARPRDVDPSPRPIWHDVAIGLGLASGGMLVGWIGSLLVGLVS